MAECKSIKPKACGGLNSVFFPTAPCGTVYFTGISDVTIEQDTDFDLTSGVHAYDGNGHEIEYTVEPGTIDTSVPGTYTFTYTAKGASSGIRPYLCGSDSVHLTDCGTDGTSVIRTIKVKSLCALVCDAAVCDSAVCCGGTVWVDVTGWVSVCPVANGLQDVTIQASADELDAYLAQGKTIKAHDMIDRSEGNFDSLEGDEISKTGNLEYFIQIWNGLYAQGGVDCTATDGNSRPVGYYPCMY